jgi:general secretion pathway protein D
MATKEDMVRIQALVHSIDTSVAQVQIEVVIAEITLNNELDVGVDVFRRLTDVGATSQTGGNATDGNAPVELPKASNIASAIGSNALPTAAALAAGPGGLTYFATFRNLKLDAIIHALASTSKSKVLSTPVILTMDNQEASITVGESVPVPQNTVSSIVGTSGTLATGQLNASIDYKDVAIELKVTPRINPDGYVRMDIEQKVNDLGASVNIGGTVAPTILKREAKSSVAVQDGSTIMLGGLIKENKTKTETKVPFLGDIPFFGQLFKGQTNNKQRNELVIFIRPTVLRTDDAAMAEAGRRTRGLNLGRDLDLDQFFATTNAPTSGPARSTGPAPAKGAAPARNPAPAKTSSAVSTNRAIVAVNPPAQTWGPSSVKSAAPAKSPAPAKTSSAVSTNRPTTNVVTTRIKSESPSTSPAPAETITIVSTNPTTVTVAPAPIESESQSESPAPAEAITIVSTNRTTVTVAPEPIESPPESPAPAEAITDVSTNRPAAATLPASTESPSDRRSTKVKALKLQDGDISAQ